MVGAFLMVGLGGGSDRRNWLAILSQWFRLSGRAPRPSTCLTLTPGPDYRELP
ncbi:hypothetical protein FC50_GL001127 [Lacticaseibacillus pantheris DSM 15945 = JCM 12539 = NBRC 106106]|uniref:Uncharacterized protein n=1 Tax=Lacticaseibacillus pantheris DSM 15945 = JCM 12539 = NBRC 106106 TaxID=1423783 RepID=A0A0R1U788_9LACO|nr:hypothetical protein FC50_GL001127 [Lacticaseibacillus pantheris DSM 15945 = JCM 12539 = NBRC 106106]